MTHRIISVPIHIYDAIQDLQHRILAHEVEANEARTEMSDLIAPYCTHLPIEGQDTTTIVLEKSIISTIGSQTRGKAN